MIPLLAVLVSTRQVMSKKHGAHATAKVIAIGGTTIGIMARIPSSPIVVTDSHVTLFTYARTSCAMTASTRLQNIPAEVHTRRILSPEQSLVVQVKIPMFTVSAA